MIHEPDMECRVYLPCLQVVGDDETWFVCCGTCHDVDKLEICCHARDVAASKNVEQTQKEITKQFGGCWNFKHEVELHSGLILPPGGKIVFHVTVNDKGESSNMRVEVVNGQPYVAPTKPEFPPNIDVPAGQRYGVTRRGRLALFLDRAAGVWADLTRLDWAEM